METQIAVEIQSGELLLEGLLDVPTSANSKCPGVVVCHPHPRYSGDMYNTVVSGVAAELSRRGFGVLRFNFRGVGFSEGEFGWGAGECQDAKAAADFIALREEIDPSRVGIAGYSFGAAIAIQAAMDSANVQAVASVACPAAQLRALSGLEILQPKLLLQGDNDHDFSDRPVQVPGQTLLRPVRERGYRRGRPLLQGSRNDCRERGLRILREMVETIDDATDRHRVLCQEAGARRRHSLSVGRRGPEAGAGVVVCHSHPMLGGDMDDAVVSAICRASVREGLAALRFNFRGVGNSQGEFSNGDQEHNDVKAALKLMKAWPGVDGGRVAVAGLLRRSDDHARRSQAPEGRVRSDTDRADPGRATKQAVHEGQATQTGCGRF